jgi:4-oxalocrotonate tautomerase
MPLVNITLVDGVFTEAQKHAMAADITDVMVKHEGSEAFRDVVWVLIEELHTDGWHIGGEPFRGPKSLLAHLEHSKQPTSRSRATRQPVRNSRRSHRRPTAPADRLRRRVAPAA